MPKGFSNSQKQVITEKLIEECQRSWQRYGYRRTSIDQLCQSSGISKGAFYLFFDSKEALFYEVFRKTQDHLYALAEQQLQQSPSKEGLGQALKIVFTEYQHNPFLTDSRSSDFLSFYHKLNDQQRSELMNISYQKTLQLFHKSYLPLKVSEDLAISVLSVLMNSNLDPQQTLTDSQLVFEFMVDHLLDDLFQ